MPEEPYKNREIDAKLEAVIEASDANRVTIIDEITEVRKDVARNDKDYRESLSTISAQVGYTNGKVRKLIITAILLSGIVIGQNFTNFHDIIALFAGSVGLN